MQARLGLTLVGLHVLWGCTTLSAQDDVPAVITGADAASRAQLQRTVSEALGGAPVTLADDALEHDDRLIVERARLLDPAGRRVDGRALEAPERFRLALSGSSCVLIREADGARFALRATRCRAQTDR
jgi:hypothetical protein